MRVRILGFPAVTSPTETAVSITLPTADEDEVVGREVIVADQDRAGLVPSEAAEGCTDRVHVAAFERAYGEVLHLVHDQAAFSAMDKCS